ncbi:organoarsenical effux MFS transporter ArsJ [Ectothiorhodospiraceae bacterium 2226]|nr:organoarsenical effux MFS transporter ArsJ [Ectothiorhodospiraceae bacterium 2226]
MRAAPGMWRNYALVTAAYWGFTLTDGALRMLVLLYFYQLGYSPFTIALLFVLYEFFGVVTNLLGGWIASHTGLRATLFGGLALQVIALSLLALMNPDWAAGLAVAYVMLAQALSGIAKDLTKMSAKSAIKLVVPQGSESALFRWVAVLTGSKNALKGAGFFLGGALLAAFGFHTSLWLMAAGLALVLIASVLALPRAMGRAKVKVKFKHLLSKSAEINRLSAARFFLFGARDIWFVVALPLYLAATLGWAHPQVGAFLAAWVIGYGAVQSLAPAFVRRGQADGRLATRWAALLALATAAIPLALLAGAPPTLAVTLGLGLFGILFALNSALHSYLILSYSNADQVTVNVGFYYMANAAGRLVGTLLSGLVFQLGGLHAALWAAALFIAAATVLSLRLPAAAPPLAEARTPPR